MRRPFLNLPENGVVSQPKPLPTGGREVGKEQSRHQSPDWTFQVRDPGPRMSLSVGVYGDL